MTFTKFQFNNFCYWPSNPKKIVEFIGGSYLASKPDLTYRRFIESLINKNYAVHAYKYTPQFDHQQLAIKAWKDFKNCRISLSKRIGASIPSIRIGHSLGCKLHLISPDGGRNCEKFISISFNNFSAYKSIPLLKQITQKFWSQNDVLITPTVGALYTKKICESDPLGPNFKNGTYTNFANLLGLNALAIPFGKSSENVPWGLTLYSQPNRIKSSVQLAKDIANFVKS